MIRVDLPVVELRQGAGQEEEEEADGAAAGEGHQGWRKLGFLGVLRVFDKTNIDMLPLTPAILN